MHPSRHFIHVTREFPAAEACIFFEQLEDQSRRLIEDTRGLTAEDLAWQAAPGMNSIGMLLAHIAIVEVHWTQIGPLALAKFDARPVIGIGIDDDGMPIAAGAAPPAILRGRELAFYDDLLSSARAYTRAAFASLTDADLDREVKRTRRDGTPTELNVRWILYHMVEHEAGHYGQINLLRHLRTLAALAS